MNRKALWILGGTVVVVSLAFGLSQLFAQHGFRNPVQTGDGQVGRFQVVTVQANEIVLLDTTTGELYSAAPSDVKPFALRPRPTSGFRSSGSAPSFPQTTHIGRRFTARTMAAPARRFPPQTHH